MLLLLNSGPGPQLREAKHRVPSLLNHFLLGQKVPMTWGAMSEMPPPIPASRPPLHVVGRVQPRERLHPTEGMARHFQDGLSQILMPCPALPVSDHVFCGSIATASRAALWRAHTIRDQSLLPTVTRVSQHRDPNLPRQPDPEMPCEATSSPLTLRELPPNTLEDIGVSRAQV